MRFLRWLPVRARKEVRSLLPAWAGCACAIVAATLTGGFRFGFAAYFLGAVSLGAMSIGQEYSHRTLGVLLAQPVGRARLLMVKVGVLASMLAPLGLIAALMLLTRDAFQGRQAQFGLGWATVLGPLLCALVIAPWLTMLSRSPLAGLVFTAAIPAVLWIGGDLLALARYGIAPAMRLEAAEFRILTLWLGMLMISAVAAISDWRMFVRLEVIDGPGQEMHMPGWLGSRSISTAVAPAAAARHPFWLLLKKEIHLQHLTVVVAGLYAVGCVIVFLVEREMPQSQTNLIYVLTLFEVGLVPVLAGSLASAEERQLGTLEWQALLPVSAWKLWATKVGLTVGLAVIVAAILPVTLMRLDPSDSDRIQFGHLLQGIATVVVLLTVASLYVSSLCTGGLRAVLVSLPAILGAAACGSLLLLRSPTFAPLRSISLSLISQPFTARARLILFHLEVWLPFIVGAGLILLLLRLAFGNHYSAERGGRRLRTQLILLMGYFAVAVVLDLAVGSVVDADMTRRIEVYRAHHPHPK